MKYLIYLFAIIALLGINIGLFNSLQIGGQVPNLLFLLTAYFAVEKKGRDFLFIALVSGIFLDFYSSSFFGGYTLGLLGLALGLHLFANNLLFFDVNWKSLILLVALSLLALEFFLWLYGWAVYKTNLTPYYSSFKLYAGVFLPNLFYNLLLFYPMYLVYSSLKRYVESLGAYRRGIVR